VCCEQLGSCSLHLAGIGGDSSNRNSGDCSDGQSSGLCHSNQLSFRQQQQQQQQQQTAATVATAAATALVASPLQWTADPVAPKRASMGRNSKQQRAAGVQYSSVTLGSLKTRGEFTQYVEMLSHHQSD
jgi:hypothetical protein